MAAAANECSNARTSSQSLRDDGFYRLCRLDALAHQAEILEHVGNSFTGLGALIKPVGSAFLVDIDRGRIGARVVAPQIFDEPAIARDR